MKTYEELEREAYIRGDTKLADLYDIVNCSEDAVGELADGYDTIRDLEWDVEYLQGQIKDLEDDVEYYRQKAVLAEGKLEEIAAKIEE